MSVHTSDTFWNPNTAYKVVIKFSELKDSTGETLGLSDYTAYLREDDTDSKFIIGMNIDRNEGNTSDSILGKVESSVANITLYDSERTLDIDYADSPYRSALIQGIKVYMYISNEIDSSKEPGTDAYHIWKNYGTWYTAGFSGSFSDGGYNEVNIQLEDRINVIGSKEIKFSDSAAMSFAGVNIVDLLRSAFAAVGVSTSEYSIDSSFDEFSLQYGIINGTLFRDFLNNACQLMLARAVVGVDGVIRIEPAFKGGSEEWIIEGQNELSSEVNSNAMYNAVVVDYYAVQDCSYDRILTATRDLKYDHSMVAVPDAGVNVISLPFTDTVMSVCGVQVVKSAFIDEDVANTSGDVRDIKWGAWQSGITLRIDVTNDIDAASIKIDGIVASTEARESGKYLIDAGVQSETSRTFHFDSKQMMTASDADDLAQYIATYCKKMRNTKHMRGTVYSPFMGIGDKITIQNSGSAYNGSYRLTGLSISIGEDYNLDMTLIKIDEEE